MTKRNALQVLVPNINTHFNNKIQSINTNQSINLLSISHEKTTTVSLLNFWMSSLLFFRRLKYPLKMTIRNQNDWKRRRSLSNNLEISKSPGHQSINEHEKTIKYLYFHQLGSINRTQNIMSIKSDKLSRNVEGVSHQGMAEDAASVSSLLVQETSSLWMNDPTSKSK